MEDISYINIGAYQTTAIDGPRCSTWLTETQNTSGKSSPFPIWERLDSDSNHNAFDLVLQTKKSHDNEMDWMYVA